MSGTPFMAGKKPLDVLIIGGSSAGLMAGILLKRQGHNVHILDSAITSEREGSAAGITLAAGVGDFFEANDRLKEIPFGVLNDYGAILEWDLTLIRKISVPSRLTTWETMYYRLRANFDSYKSSHCPNPPPLDPSDGRAVVELKIRALRVEDPSSTRKLSVLTEDVESQSQTSYDADIVIAADGFNSTIRRQLQPDLHRDEPGYLLWRGTVPSKNLSQSLVSKIGGHTNIYKMQKSYAVIYTIPGPNGSLEDSDRDINFGWYYWNAPTEIASILTDTDGRSHHTTVPKGKMRQEVWQKQLEIARQMFHPELLELVEKIASPFVSIISSLVSKRAAFFENRLFLIGDALAQKQPNTGQGTALAAANAMSLAAMIGGKMSPEGWEKQVLEEGESATASSKAFAAQFLGTSYPYSDFQVVS